MLHAITYVSRALALLVFLSLFVFPLHRASAQKLCEAPPLPQRELDPQHNGRPLLKIAADPNNLPFSNEQCEGLENKLANLVAKELGVDIEYVWRAQRRGFFRHTLKEGPCDLVMGVPEQLGAALTTHPYYRSSYVFVTRKDRDFQPASFDDATLSNLKIGIQMINDDGRNTPPAHALAARGLIKNVVGYTVYGDYSLPNPPARIVDAVARGDVDTAVVWGPLAGYFASKSKEPLSVRLIEGQVDRTGLPLTFAISIGVRRDRPELRDRINQVLIAKKAEVHNLLKEFHVPIVELDDEIQGTSKNHD